LRFAVHGPARWLEGSPCCHGTSCRDVLGRVHIRVIRMSAGATAKDRLALAVVRSAMPTGVTGLRCERGIDPLHPAHSLVLKTPHEPAPAGRVDGPVQARFGPNVRARRGDGAACRTDHVRDLEVLHPDQVETASQISGDLLHPIPTPVTLTGHQPPDRRLETRAADRPTLGTCQPAPQTSQTLGLAHGQTRHRQQLPTRQRGRNSHTTIHTNDLTPTRPLDRWRDHRERHMPAARPITVHPKRLDLSGNLAGPAEPYPTDLRDPHLTRLTGQTPHIPLPTTPPNDPEPLMHTRLPPGRTAMRTGEEITHGLGEIPQCLLLHRLRARRQPPELSSGLGQLTGLLVITRCARPAQPPMLMLLTRQIPHKTGMRAMLQQHRLLDGRGHKPKPHTTTLKTTTDNPRRERRFLPGLKTGAPTPRKR